MNDGLKDKHREAIIGVLAKNPRVERAVLFGSRAMGAHTPGSDVDLALYGDALTLDDQARLAAEIEELPVPQQVDLVKNIYAEGELTEEATIKQYLIVRREGDREVSRHVLHYNLDAVLAVGYRVQSPRGTEFRQWATERLREYLVKGFTLDDERLKGGGGLADYFDELLAGVTK